MGDGVEEKYMTELAALKINSKPLINSLTMMAEDFIQSAPVIVQIIEKHLARVPPEYKLPVLYLIDSIVKNIKKQYIELFSQNIVTTFCGVFESVGDRSVRGNLFKLRQTWVDVFPTKKLMTIDLRCSDLDEKWPIGVGLQLGGANTANTIHVNPKFLPSSQLRNNMLSLSYDSSSLSAEPNTAQEADAELRKQFIMKQKQLIELQEKKLELELLEKQFNMEEQARKKKQQEDQANAKLLAQAELAKQKTHAATSIMARAGATPQSPIESPEVFISSKPTSPTSISEAYQHPPKVPDRLERISNPQILPSDPRVRRNVVLQQLSPMPVRRMTPWNSSPETIQRVSRNPDVILPDVKPLGSPFSPRRSPPPPPAAPKLGRRGSAEHRSRKSEERSVELTAAAVASPRHSPIDTIRRSKSKSPKREQSVAVPHNHSSSKDGQGSSSGSNSGKHSAEDEKASPQRSAFHGDTTSTMSLSSSPSRRSQSPRKSVFEKDRSDRKSSRASSKSSTGSRRSGTGSEKEDRIERKEKEINTSTHEKDVKFTTERAKKSRADNRRTQHERGSGGDKLDRSSSSTQSTPSPTKKRAGQRSVDRLKPKDSKFSASADIDLRFDEILLGHSSNGKRGSSTVVEKDPYTKEKEPKKNRRGKQERKSSTEDDDKARIQIRKAEREKQRENKREQFKSRTSAVLSRNYRKRSGIPEVEEEDPKVFDTTSDIDQRFANKVEKDVDLRKLSTQSGKDSSEQPSAKKSRNSSLIDNLFGREDVDLRPSSSSWSQVKKPNEDGRRDSIESCPEVTTDEQLKDMLRDGKQRPPPPLSPASSVGSTAPSGCDALGRPLAFARLPDDPEERRRSLGTRSASIDPVETFRQRYIETPLRVKGRLDSSDLELALSQSKHELDQGTLTSSQFNIISKQLVQLNEGIKIRKVQEMDNLRPGSGHLPNPWNPDANPIWAVLTPGFQRPPPPMIVGRPKEPMWARGVPLGAPHGPNPFIEAINPNPVPEILIPVVNPMELSNLEQDIDGTTPLDKIPRQVRFYGTTAIVFTGKFSDEPKEISFIPEDGLRTLYINGEPIKIRWNVTRKFYYAKKSHSIRIGAPTRELYIDGIGYEVYFGGIQSRISVDNNLVSFRLAGPPPGVKIGQSLRYDLVAGRTTVFVDGNPYSLYLDAKPQILDFAGFPVIAQFCEEFRSITFNGLMFPTLFGGPPRPVLLPNGRRLYIRFNAVSPITEQNIIAYIRSQPQHINPGNTGHRPRESGTFLPGPNQNSLPGFPHHPVQELPNSTNPLDMVANLLSPSTNTTASGVLDNSYEVEPSSNSKENLAKTAQGEESSSSGPLNVQDLLSKLLLAGLLPAGNKPKEEANGLTEEGPKESVNEEKTDEVQIEHPKVEKSEPISPPAPPVEVVNVNFNDNLKKRRPKVIDSLYLGVQCGSCGLRFPADQNYRYTQHLDWHFRQNRKEKANARKALCRKWYYDLSDWIQFEEVEDLEDRASSVFEPQELDMEDDKGGGTRLLDPDSYTVLATGLEGILCPQCGEGFETFFDEEKEEWRLRDALQDPQPVEVGDAGTEDKKLFHPICHQDYLNSLVEDDEPKVEAAGTSLAPGDDDDEVLIIREGPKEVVLMEVDIAEDDDTSTKMKGNDMETGVDHLPPSTGIDIATGVNEESVVTAPKPSASYVVLSPVVIDVVEDENSNIPGIASLDGLQGNVFGFALNSSHASTTPAATEESRAVVYEAMKFDFPKIKEEPIEWKDIREDQIIMSIFPHMSPGAEPMDITLDDEDSGIVAYGSSSADTPTNSQTIQGTIHDIDLTDDDAELTATTQHPVVAEIDGNVQFRATEAVKSAPSKIKINIFGLDTASQSPTHKASVPAEEPQSASDTLKPNTPNPIPEKSESPSPPNLESLFKSDEMRRLKPKLAAAGKKLINNPVKRTGREESGLCSIM